MRTIVFFLSVSLILAVACIGQAQAPAAKLALRGFDPVELTVGKETVGKEGWSVERGLYRYQFASAENKQRFEKSPEQFAIQMGGACARMGPLSGLGSPDRYSLHAGRIYIFASDACRSAFEKAPDLFIDKDDPVPQVTPEQRKRGAELLAMVLKGFGGEALVDGVKSLKASIKITYKQADKDAVGSRTITMAFPGNFHEEERWDNSAYGHALTPGGGFRFTKSAGKPEVAYVTEQSVTKYMGKEFHRFPFALVKARGDATFIAAASGLEKTDGKEFEKLTIYLNGSSTTLNVDAKNGRVLSLNYRGRHGANAIGDVVQTFGDFRKIDGIELPFSVQTSINGKTIGNPIDELQEFVVNGPVDMSLFAVPK